MLHAEDNDDICAKCGKKQFAASNMTNEAIFQVNTVHSCGHKFCEMCLENELSRKRSFACPRCKSSVSREKLSRKSLDENEVERDFRIRRRIFSIYNKTESQFETLDLFKDYEEEREDIIFNLVHGIDEESTERKVKDYEARNILEIATNQSRKLEEKMLQEAMIREQEEQRRQRLASTQDSDEKEKREWMEYEKQMNELALGERDKITVAQPKRREERRSAANTSGPAGQLASGSTAPVMMSHVQMFLRRRPEPIPLVQPAEELAAARAALLAPETAKPGVDVYSAGGFQHLSYTRRNWVEIASSVSVTLHFAKRRRWPNRRHHQARVKPDPEAMIVTNFEASNDEPSSSPARAAKRIRIATEDNAVAESKEDEFGSQEISPEQTQTVLDWAIDCTEYNHYIEHVIHKRRLIDKVYTLAW